MWFHHLCSLSNHSRKHCSKPSQQEVEGKSVKRSHRALRKFGRGVFHFQGKSTKSESKKKGSYQRAYRRALPVNERPDEWSDRILAHHATKMEVREELVKKIYWVVFLRQNDSRQLRLSQFVMNSQRRGHDWKCQHATRTKSKSTSAAGRSTITYVCSTYAFSPIAKHVSTVQG